MDKIFPLLLLATSALAAPAALLSPRALPSVTIQNGTIIGSTASGVDSFKGIPFAKPPVGNLRLKPPQSLTESFGTITSQLIPRACPQMFFQVNTGSLPQDAIATLLDTPLFQTVTNQGEDCLTINVQRPSTATATSKLPVLFWIFGGGFELGSTQMYDGTAMVQKSIALGEPILFVAVNYRVGGFGFLGGKEVKADGSSNLGLRDQRLGLKWVSENIAAFGGDPEKVTIWGESAGSISVLDQTIIEGGNHIYNGKPLFRAGIMNSGSIVPAQAVDHHKPQAVYDTVIQQAGCSSASDTLACLRTVDYTTLLNAMNSVPSILSYRSVDLSYLPRPDPSDNFFSLSPEESIQTNKYAKVPVIVGDQEDEGTILSLTQTNITTTADLVAYLDSYFPDLPTSTVQQLVDSYPDDASDGSPFRTGILNNVYPQYKRVAAIIGDVTFTLSRRAYLSVVSSQISTWSYLSTYLHAIPVIGTCHGADILTFFSGSPTVPTQSGMTYYIGFVNSLDPNSIKRAETVTTWPKYSTTDKKMLEFQALQNAITTDDFRQNQYNVILNHSSDFRI